jgi:uronate dehydrogenase
MLDTLLVTGAAGGVARQTLPMLAGIAGTLRLSDLVEPDEMPGNAVFTPCDLAEEAAVRDLVAGCDAILHLGGISVERSFAEILPANIVGLHNLYEAARANGQPRILFASSNHVVGYYRQDEWIDGTAPHRPDGWYGISKSYGEAVALMYFHKFGQESALVRIGSIQPEPKDHRMLATWMAPEDFVSLARTVFTAPRLGCPVIYGASGNDVRWWDNGQASYLGWTPARNSAEFAAALDARVERPAPTDAVAMYQGGVFTTYPVYRDAGDG